MHVKNNPSLGDSAVNNREASRFVSASTPFAGKALDVRVDGTYATALSSDALQDELQRKLGLWLSVALPTLRVALERGMPVDFFGDYLYNKAHHRRPHDGVLAAWADAMRAPANAPVVHGDKEKPELTRQYNEGYKVDLAEPHAGPGGCDEVNEVKLWTPLLKTSSPGVGNASSGGTPASVGHSYAFGNTEEKARRLNMGCMVISIMLEQRIMFLTAHKLPNGAVRVWKSVVEESNQGGFSGHIFLRALDGGFASHNPITLTL